MSEIPQASSSLTGVLAGGLDTETVEITLAPGQYVAVRLSGSIGDGVLRVYDPLGRFLTQDVQDRAGYDAVAYFGGGDGGTYRVEISDDLLRGGSYTLTTEAATEPWGGIEGILASGGRRSDSATDITVHFVEAGERSDVTYFGDSDDIVSEGWTDYEKERAMAALASIAEVADITFRETANPDADFQIVLDDNELSEYELGWFYLPDEPSGSSPQMGVLNGDTETWTTPGGIEEGGEGYATMVHEFMHGLGLVHLHDDGTLRGVHTGFDDFGLNGLNQGVYSGLSYNGGWDGALVGVTWGNEAGPSALDIAILQSLYGANMSHATGDDVYHLPDANAAGTYWKAIWDAGGTDEIRYSGTRDTLIDLREARIDFTPGGGGYLSQADGIGGGFTIARGAVIENATGGSGDDLIFGNDADNALSGGAGADVLFGFDGEDRLSGGAGSDRLVGHSGDDTLDGGSDSDDLFGGTGDDALTAGSGNDSLSGQAGRDSLNGTSGTNTLDGGSGADRITGGTGADTITGGGGDDVISGAGGADAIDGGRGDDTIDGGAGADRITGGLGADLLTGGSDADTFHFHALSDSRPGEGRRDEITDFDAAQGDLIDLSALDADLGTAGDQAFAYIGTAGFGGTAGELRATLSGGAMRIEADVTGDGAADFEVLLTGVTALSSDAFIL